MTHVVNRRPLTTEAPVRARVNPCGICSGQSGTGTGFSPSSSVSPCQYIVISSQVLFHNGSLLHSEFNIQLLNTVDNSSTILTHV
jgi:hypothetical protein